MAEVANSELPGAHALSNEPPSAQASMSAGQPPRPAMSDEQIRDAFAGRPLGVLVSRAESRALLSDLLAAASGAGLEIRVFFMDEGVRLLDDHAWVESLPPGGYSACDVSVRARGVKAPERINVAGQFHNAMMVCDAAKVVSL
jgi:hypothetical protein